MQVEDIESKLDLLFDMYKEDRKILLQHCQACSTPTGNTPSSEVTSCLKNSSSLKQPRSILSDKQCSEPTSPTVRSQEKAIQRNLSDLSQRIKKRVTYRLLSLNDQPLSRVNDVIKQQSYRDRNVTNHCDSRSLDQSDESSENNSNDRTKLIEESATDCIHEHEQKPPQKRKLSRSSNRVTDSENEYESDGVMNNNTNEQHSFQNHSLVLDLKSNDVQCSNEDSVFNTMDLMSFPGYKPK